MSLSSHPSSMPVEPPPQPPNFTHAPSNGDGVTLSSGLTMLPPRGNRTNDGIATKMVENVTLSDANGHMGHYNGPVIMEEEEESMIPVGPNPMDDPDAPPLPLTDISLEDKPLVPHGKYGQMVYMDNGEFLKYTGDWDQGYWTKGTCLYANGNVFSGSYNKEGQPHGPNGKLEWVVESRAAPGSSGGGEDTRTYQGDWQNGMRHGQGTYAWSKTGAVYQGAFCKNQREGYGSYRDPSTSIEYVGEWKQGVYHGYGQYTWKDARQQKLVYRGNFNQGRPHGQGIQVNANGDVMHDGEWANGKPVPGTSKQASPQSSPSQTSHTTMPPTTTTQQPPPPQPQRQAPPPPQNRAIPTPTPAAKNTATVKRVPPPGIGNNAPPSTTVGRPAAGAPSRSGTVTVVHDREWMDTVNQAKPNLGIYRGLWLQQNPYQNGVVAYETGEVESYEGWFNLQGYYHGQECRLNFRNGDCYIGDFEYGQRHGKGWYTWKDGRQYKGQFVKNSREGKGTLIYPNSDFYEGQFVQGKRQGHGRFIFANGSMYEGQWVSGQYHGSGTLVQSDGSTYTGSFERGLKHGKGKDLNQAGKLVYEGNYWRGKAGDGGPPPASTTRSTSDASNKSNGSSEAAAPQTAAAKLQQYQAPAEEPRSGQGGKSAAPVVESYWVPDDEDTHGSGVAPIAPPQMAPPPMVTEEPPCEAVVDQEITDCQGNPGRFTGLVLVSTKRPHGVGRLVYQDGKRIHEGFWRNGSKEGHGRCLFFPQGDFHEGEYQNNLRNGPGRYQWKDGRLFMGSYKDDLRHGKGVFTYPSGDRYDGMFAKGQRSGFGKFKFAGGLYEGEWHAGKYHGRGKLTWGHGSEYEGDFAQGMFHGVGVLRNDSGHVLEKGRWFKGKRVASESAPTAPPPAAAPPLPPSPPAADTSPPAPKAPEPSNEEQEEPEQPEEAPLPPEQEDGDDEDTGASYELPGTPADELKTPEPRGSTPVTVESYAVEDEDAPGIVPMSSPPLEGSSYRAGQVEEDEDEDEQPLPLTAVEL